MYVSTTKGDVVKRSNCILVYGSTTKGDVVKRSNCILVYKMYVQGIFAVTNLFDIISAHKFTIHTQ